VLILNDDMGYSDIGCYGGEIDTPNLNRLAANGLRFSQFYNTARCSPSRASLLTGLHPHQTGIGVLTYDFGPEGYSGDLAENCVTIAEALKGSAYRTYMSGKWHVAKSLKKPTGSWPLARGFDEFFGTIIGAGSFYDPSTLTRGDENVEHEAKGNPDFFYTDAINDQAAAYVRKHCRDTPDSPFFMYVAHTAPHWPLHAHDEDIAKYKGRFDAGWDQLRVERLERLVRSGILKPLWKLSDRDPTQPPWTQAQHKQWLLRCMEVYAAQIDRMDQGIGRILQALDETGMRENTLILFLSDNGGTAEPVAGRGLNDPSVPIGARGSYVTYLEPWANVSNTPFRLYKNWAHEGGIITPLIAHWPRGIAQAGRITEEVGHVIDLMPTMVELAGAAYPASVRGGPVLPMRGSSLAPVFRGEAVDRQAPLFWAYGGNWAIREGDWKLVRDGRQKGPVELFNVREDPVEQQDLAARYPARVAALQAQWQAWAERVGAREAQR
jgi:arylsulfatase A-like enzyme